MATVAIDFDSTAWGFVSAFGTSGFCPQVDGKPLSYDNLTSWEMLDHLFDDDFDAMMQAMDAARTIDCLRAHGLYPGFVAAVEALQLDGHRVVILTDNSEPVIATIKQFLAEYGLHVEVVRMRSSKKAEWCLANGAAVLVDDAPGAIRSASASRMPLLAIRYRYNAEAIDETAARSVEYSPQVWWQLLDAIRADIAARN